MQAGCTALIVYCFDEINPIKNLNCRKRSWIKELRQLSAVILSNDHIEDYLNFADKWPFKSIFITNA
ncbi:uncharacterized protein OCT59_013993 [Rhizophagus irregularis]|uniref:uncharacterized protein n=1 Tax=Rhizophagus irregularis TaxID=588596 RepID=UPI00332B2476|nr:hypothetical protein OCT59_013993 [Rhizophagus irregularis]